MSDLNETMEAAAKRRGLQIVYSDMHHLQIDLDSEEAVAEFYDRLRDVSKNLEDTEDPFHSCLDTTSQNGGKHVYIRLKNGHSVVERIGLQAILGSDPKRELLSLVRYLNSSERVPSVLFETEEEYKRVREFLDGQTEDRCGSS